MKPRVLIGSSRESVRIANAIQANLDYDADVTVWTQDVFERTNNALDSLLKALDRFDFGVFVFQPDDKAIIRQELVQTVRDNLIFELGLFLGRLGKERVFFLIPRSAEALHLPTDLLGIVPGTFNDKRPDGNTRASVEPFCEDIRKSLSKFMVDNLQDFQDEPIIIKELVIQKPKYWEFYLAAELLAHKMTPIHKTYDDLKSNRIIRIARTFSAKEFHNWWSNYVITLGRILPQYQIFVQDLLNAYGPQGVAGNAVEIKQAVERLVNLCSALLSLELELEEIEPPDALKIVRTRLLGLTKSVFVDEVTRLGKDTKSFFDNIDPTKKPIEFNLVLRLNLPPLDDVTQAFANYLILNGNL